MKQLASLFLLLFCLAAPLSAQHEMSRFPANGTAPALENGGNDFENVALRSAYWMERNAYPGERIPPGAYRNSVLRKQAMARFSPPLFAKTAGAMKWTNIGPVNIGGRIVASAINPKNPRVMYIGAADGGVWKTFNAGASWFSVSDDFPTQSMGALAIDPVDTSVVYAGTGEAGWGGRMFEGMGIMKSTNGGVSWTALADTTIPPLVRVAMFALNPQTPAILYAAIPEGSLGSGEGGIYKSTNAGANWSRVFTGICTDVIINPKNPDILYTASSKMVSGTSASRYGIYKTTDAGAIWNKLDVPYGVPDDQMGRTALGLSAEHPEVVYAGISEVTGSAKTWLLGIFRTLDGGDTWQKVPVPFDYMVSQGWYDNCIGVNPKNPDIVLAGGVKLIRTSDGGATWQRIPDQVQGGVLHVDQHEILFDPVDPDKAYIGDDGGFFRISGNGQVTEKVDYGLAITQFVGGAMHPTSDAYQLGGTQDNGTMYSFTAPDWDRVYFGDGGFTQINTKNPAIQFTTDWGLSLSRSEDFGRTWERALSGFPANENCLFYSPYAMDPQLPEFLYFGTSRIFKTTNSGALWTPMNQCMFPNGGYCYYVSAVSVAPYDGRLVFAGSTGVGVAISTDGGATWRNTNPGPQRWTSSIRSFTPGVIYVTLTGYGSDHIFESTDFGNSWHPIQGDLPDTPVNDLFVRGSTFIAGTDIGTFISTNNGTNWQVLGDGMQTVSVQQLLFNENTGTLRAITHGRGMYDMAFETPATAGPLFASLPDTTLLQPGQDYIYAAVARAFPPAAYKIVQGPAGMTIDATLGLLQWTAKDLQAPVTIEASNSAGSARQSFTLRTASSAPAFDWEMISPERVTRRATRLFNIGRDILWLGHDTGMVSRSTDGGLHWTRMQIAGPQAKIHDLYAFDANTCIVTTEYGSFLKTTDGGATWRTVFSGINARFGSIHFFNAQKGIAVTQGERDSADVFFSYDGGDTWTKSTARRPFAQAPIPGSLTFVDDSYGWFASSNRNTPDYAELLRTIDGGATWVRAKTHCRDITSIGMWPNGTGFIVDRQSGAVDKVKNYGSGFTLTTTPFSGAANHTVQVFDNNVVWVVNDDKAWISRDGGTVWTPTTLVPSGVISSAAFADSSLGWAVSHDGAVQRHTLNPMVSVPAAGKPLPGDIALRNYPNPFGAGAGAASSTTIRFNIPERAQVTLRIYNAVGRLLEELVNEPLERGDYYVAWNGSGMASGTYFTRLTAGDRVLTRALVLVK